MNSFLKTLLIILLVYYGLKFLFRLLKPYLFRFLAKKVNQKFEHSFGQNPFQQNTSDTNQNTSSNTSTNNTRTSKKVVGEYIDFEEID